MEYRLKKKVFLEQRPEDRVREESIKVFGANPIATPDTLNHIVIFEGNDSIGYWNVFENDEIDYRRQHQQI